MNTTHEFESITKKEPRPDAVGKVTGMTRYCSDYSFTDMLYGAIHQASVPHAEIVSIDVAKTEKMEGVIRIFTAKDIPGKKMEPSGIGTIPVLADKIVKYAGETIALVIANTQENARNAAKEIVVKYKPLPVVSDPVQALESDSPNLGEGMNLFGIPAQGNVVAQLHTTQGDIEKGFGDADVVLERTYKTPAIEHQYMERECAIAVYDGYEMIILANAQYPFETQKQPAETLGIDLAHVIIKQTPIGGSFGGKAESVHAVASLAALGAFYLNKPVRMELSTEESMRMSSKRHPFVITLKAGVKNDGTFTAIQVKNISDTGPYIGTGPFVLFRAHSQSGGPYNWQNWKVDSYCVLTNNALGASMRGFGNPQIIFATESMIDALAAQINMDPMDIRLKNGFEEKSTTMTDQVLDNMPVNLKKCIERVRALSNWDQKRKDYANDTGRYRRGIGMASSWRGCSFGGEGFDFGGAFITLLKDGTVSISCGITESGQGAKIALAQIAAEVLGISVDRVNYRDLETTVTPDILTTSASRGTMIGGSSVKLAAEKLRSRIFAHAAKLLHSEPDNMTSKDNMIWDRTIPDKKISYSEISPAMFWGQAQMTEFSWYLPPKITWEPAKGKGSTYYTFHWMAQVFDLTVDTETGDIAIEHIYAVHDPGRVINPDMARGQVIGAISWGIGFGLTEEVVLEKGVFQSLDYTNYKILRASDMPPVTLEFLNIPDPNGPFGAKSVAEPGLDLPGAAIANAVGFSTGFWSTQLPLKPERVLKGLEE